MNLTVPQKVWNWGTGGFSRRAQLDDVVTAATIYSQNFILSRSELHTKNLLGPPVRPATQGVLEKKTGDSTSAVDRHNHSTNSTG
jgi:hypothetical protein